MGANKEVLVREAVKVECQVLASELEALLVEAELVHRYQPRLNILLKDDKSPIYVVITREVYPRVLTARKREIDRGKIQGEIYGPFPSAYMLNKVLRMIRPIFRWCNQAAKREARRPAYTAAEKVKPCFYFHLDQCSGACVGLVGAREYRTNITRLRRFLRGQTAAVLRQLKTKIEVLSQENRFEEAAVLKDQYESIQQVTNPEFRLEPDVALPRLRSAFGTQAVQLLREVVTRELDLPAAWQPRRIECYDVSNLQGKLATVSQVVFTGRSVRPQPVPHFPRPATRNTGRLCHVAPGSWSSPKSSGLGYS